MTIPIELHSSNTPGGVEQPVWDPVQDVFLVMIPGTSANPNGEVDVISPKTFQITKVFPIATNCQPNGGALGNNENLYLGCSATTGTLQTLVMNATNGAIIATIPGVAGGDEVWYSSSTNRFYCACSNNPASAGGPVLLVVDAGTNTVFQTIPTTAGAHSVAVDPASDLIFLPQRPTNAANDGVYVFGH
ncbi:MAG: YncE family protein [Candidatus Velthaea sp.]